MMIIRKQCFRWMVIGMCMTFLLSLFGCNKDKYILDGPGTHMERQLWSEFTISQISDEYGQNFSYTVKYDETEDKGYLYMEVPHETKGYPIEKNIQLDSETINELINLDLLSFDDKLEVSEGLGVKILDGTFLRFSVTDSSGNVFKKSISSDAEQKLLTLITPYVKKIEENKF